MTAVRGGILFRFGVVNEGEQIVWSLHYCEIASSPKRLKWQSEIFWGKIINVVFWDVNTFGKYSIVASQRYGLIISTSIPVLLLILLPIVMEHSVSDSTEIFYFSNSEIPPHPPHTIFQIESVLASLLAYREFYRINCRRFTIQTFSYCYFFSIGNSDRLIKSVI